MHAGLLLLLVLLAPPNAPAAALAQKTEEDCILEIKSLMAETGPLIEQLFALQNRYQNPRTIRALASERRRLRSAVADNLDRYGKLDEEFNTLRKEREIAETVKATGQYMSGTFKLDVAVQTLQKGLDIAKFSSTAGAWRDSALLRLAAEDVTFKAAERNARNQKWLAGAAVLLLVFLAIAVIVAVRSARAKARLETDISKFAASPGVVYLGGVQTPAGSRDNAEPASVARVLGGNYLVVQELGRGGMGIVFEANDLGLRRKVAIKQLRKELQERPQDLENLLAEARMVAMLKHPNIVEIHSIFKESGQVYLVFEHVAGRNLHLVMDESRFTFREARTMLRQIGTALDYAHGLRVIHRDLKPSNIMITTDGVVKVMDFGIAHQAKVTAAKLTKAEAWGTPPYMAPEQEMGTVSKESDLYALGVCLYEMATGKLPFDGPNFLAQKNAMKHAPPSSVRPGLPPGIDAVIAKALQADPAGRFHSAAEMIAAVDALPDAGIDR